MPEFLGFLAFLHSNRTLDKEFTGLSPEVSLIFQFSSEVMVSYLIICFLASCPHFGVHLPSELICKRGEALYRTSIFSAVSPAVPSTLCHQKGQEREMKRLTLTNSASTSHTVLSLLPGFKGRWYHW